jgi:hypothetical protein
VITPSIVLNTRIKPHGHVLTDTNNSFRNDATDGIFVFTFSRMLMDCFVDTFFFQGEKSVDMRLKNLAGHNLFDLIPEKFPQTIQVVRPGAPSLFS